MPPCSPGGAPEGSPDARYRSLAAAFEAALPQLLAAAERVVSIDSGSYDAAGVNAVQDRFATLLQQAGFTVERRPLPGRGDQLTARRGGSGPRLLVLGHADTVWPAGTAAAWPCRRGGDAVTGPGIGDMKLNVLMAIEALRLLPQVSATFLIVPDEEIGSPQSRAWIEAEARGQDYCLTLEPARPGGGTVIGRGAVGAFYIRASGVTAHCGAAREAGASALAALAPMVAEIEALADFAAGSYATCGILRAGAARQVVPGEAELHVDLRAPDDATAESLLAAVRAIATRPPADPRVVVEVSGGFTRPAFPTLPGGQRLYDRAAGFAAALGAPIFPLVSRGGSDGSFAARLGVPTLDGLGPVGHEICSRREWVEVSSIPARGAILAGLMAAGAP
ncbi:M20/M25/M40 family metallo-hydrolase [Siccirubricoccus phaeus]|uniref:M20/M25/M40 family metallo-hydrolase n=1 Tax=Siccirubricoccus phaeus TaxID=2595053 RepID=UPI00165B0603|nr:M20/M25/M40 family metallo-hydrolase [Siccirubricoccus phaeus]